MESGGNSTNNLKQPGAEQIPVNLTVEKKPVKDASAAGATKASTDAAASTATGADLAVKGVKSATETTAETSVGTTKITEATSAANAVDSVSATNAPQKKPSEADNISFDGVILPPDSGAGQTEATIEALLDECIRHNASDLHLQVGLAPVLRIDGVLRSLTGYPALTPEKIEELVFATLDDEQKKILEKDKEFDYSFAFGDLGRFRVNAFHEKGNLAASFRLIPNQVPQLSELGLPGVVETFAERPHGLVLVTGPTGSGKSTTLAALIDKINTEKSVHIITIEDPIEFTHRSKRSVVAQREVHYDTFSFAAALRSILREDPDVVLIGEMRDLETIQAAITVAETGHLVFATLHTNSAAQSIDRIIDVFPAHQQPQIRSQLANVLSGIVSQRLVPAVNGGRIAVTEILVANPAVRAIIREGKTHQLDMAIQTSADQGMQTMDRELARLVKAGIINYDVAREYTVDPNEYERLARI